MDLHTCADAFLFREWTYTRVRIVSIVKISVVEIKLMINIINYLRIVFYLIIHKFVHPFIHLSLFFLCWSEH